MRLCSACSSASPSGFKPEPLHSGLPAVNTHQACVCPAHGSFQDPSVRGCFWQRGCVHDCFIPDKLGEKPRWLSLEDPSLPLCPLTAASPRLIKWTSYAKQLPLILSTDEAMSVRLCSIQRRRFRPFLSAGSGLAALLLCLELVL